MLVLSPKDNVIAAIKAATGVAPTRPMVAVVVGGEVTDVIAADPALDNVPGASLVTAYPGVSAGQTYDPTTATFTAPAHVVSVKRGQLLPSGDIATQDTEVAVPAAVVPKVAQEKEGALSAGALLKAIP